MKALVGGLEMVVQFMCRVISGLGVNGLRPLVKKALPNDALISSLILSDSKTWDVGLINQTFLPFEAEAMLKMPISHRFPKDSQY